MMGMRNKTYAAEVTRSCLLVLVLCLLVRVSVCVISSGDIDNYPDNTPVENEDGSRPSPEPSPKQPKQTNVCLPKLLVFMIDGFRWDYYNIHRTNMDAFDEFLSEGVQVEWVEPIFPSLSYPAWATINTGVYPEVHGIIGNYMYDQRTEAIFDLNNEASTKRLEWWQDWEPIWISATRATKRIFQRYWSRCDVPYLPFPLGSYANRECTGYSVAKGINAIQSTLSLALQKLRDNDFLMIYGEHIDNIGHSFGPNSTEMAFALKELNRVFKGFLDELMDNYDEIYEELNIIIISDHGMTGRGPETNVTYVDLKDYIELNDVIKILDYGAVASIAPEPRSLEKVYADLKRMPGVDVYKRDEIPEEYHYKNHRLVLDILLVAKPDYFIRGFPAYERYSRDRANQKQIPPVDSSVVYYGGVHGYPPSVPDMRSIFFAKGPAFKKGIVHPPIQMVDIYQIFAKVLDMKPEAHNGSWDRVSGMFVDNGATSHSLRFVGLFSTFAFVFTLTHLLSHSWGHF